MKRIITIVAIAIAVAIPAAAQTILDYDYTTSTRLLEMVEDAIDAGNIIFDTYAHKTQFLQAIQSLYTYRNAENWSNCVIIADNLVAASQYIVDEDVSYNVGRICAAVGGIYGEGSDEFNCCSIDSEDESGISDGLIPLCGLKIWIEFSKKHLQPCDEKKKEHQEEACEKKLEIKAGVEWT